MRVAFGQWLQGLQSGDEWIGRLAVMAAQDDDFPVGGDADVVRAHLSRHEAEPDLFEALDDAERRYRAAA